MDATRGASSELRNHRRSALSARLSGVWTMSVLRPAGDGDLGTAPTGTVLPARPDIAESLFFTLARSFTKQPRKKEKESTTTITTTHKKKTELCQ